jgi:hypothetical protein
MNLVTTLVNTLEGLLRPDALGPKADQPLFETYFVFAAIWAFGGALVEKDGVDYRRKFDKWWKATWTTVKLPGARRARARGRVLCWMEGGVSACARLRCPRSQAVNNPLCTRPCPPPRAPGKGSVYDYYVSPKTAKFTPWAELIVDVPYNSATTPMGSVFVPTPETASLRFFLDSMARTRGGGTGACAPVPCTAAGPCTPRLRILACTQPQTRAPADPRWSWASPSCLWAARAWARRSWSRASSPRCPRTRRRWPSASTTSPTWRPSKRRARAPWFVRGMLATRAGLRQ